MNLKKLFSQKTVKVLAAIAGATLYCFCWYFCGEYEPPKELLNNDTDI